MQKLLKMWAWVKNVGLPVLVALGGLEATNLGQGSDALFHEVISLRADVNGLYAALGIPLPQNVPEEAVAGLDARRATMELKDTVERLEALLSGKRAGVMPELKEARERVPLKVRRTRDAAKAYREAHKTLPKSLDELVAQKGH